MPETPVFPEEYPIFRPRSEMSVFPQRPGASRYVPHRPEIRVQSVFTTIGIEFSEELEPSN
jgi:hypothetical protein